jgi:single-strand DNA-binding protein
MSRGLNQAQLIGNLGADPEVRSTPNGDRVATISIATNSQFKRASGEKVTKTEWHRVVAWKGLAEICEKYLKKGSRVFVQGRIQYRTWEDREGNTRYTTEIVASELVMLDSNPNPNNPSMIDSESSLDEEVRIGLDVEEEDLPF